MQLGKQVWTAVGRKASKRIVLQYDPAERFAGKALNFTGYAWTDIKYSLVKNILGSYNVIVTDSDLIAHDDYIANLSVKHTIVFLYNRDDKNAAAASKKRLKIAIEKLKAKGINTKYFVSNETLTNYLKKIPAH